MGEDQFRLGGQIKVQPEDFVVEEVWGNKKYSINRPVWSRLRDKFFAPRGKGDYIHFTLVKRNWTTIKALQYMTKRLHISLKRFGYAGMKDSRAVTAQRVSVWRVDVNELKRIRLKDVQIKDFQRSNDRIMLGDATGNRFTVTIRNIPKNKAEIRRILEAFISIVNEEKVPNLFGPQRLQGGNVAIGQAIVNGDLKQATEILLQKVQPYLDSGSIDKIPDKLWIEKRVLQHLKRLPNDYGGALRKIPRNLLQIFTYSVQSQAFNNALEKAISEGNVPETLKVEGFHVTKMPELSTRSFERRSHMNINDFKLQSVNDGVATIQFILGKGEYATTLLANLVELE